MNSRSFFSFLCLLVLSYSCQTPKWKLKDKQSKVEHGYKPDMAKILKKDDSPRVEETIAELKEQPRLLSSLYRQLLLSPPNESTIPKVNRIIRKEERSSLEQAILGLYVLQIYAEQQEAYQAAVAADESVDFEGENLLARLCAYANIDLIRLIQENSFLQTFETYRLLAKVKNGSGPKKTSLAHAIEAKFMQLHEFALLNNPLTVSPSEKKEAEKANEQVQFASDSGSNDKQEKDSSAAILQRVDSLMASNKYYEAINLLKEQYKVWKESNSNS